MFRRDLLAGAAAAAALPRIAIAQTAAARTLRYVPHANPGNIDPFTNTAFVARDHAFLVYDQLYGMDEQFRPQPQMVQGHVVENDGLLWRFTLREGLKFHDGTPVRGRDCIASIRRWGRRDAFGQELMARVADMTEESDRVFAIRLSRAFPKMLEAFSKVTTSCLFVMPERLANVDPFTNIAEAVGSGPFRFVQNEWVPGSSLVYARNPDYVPVASGTPSMTAGPKVAHFDRVEWRIIPDASTAAAALQAGEIDWWEQPTADLFPLVARNRNIAVDIINGTGLIGIFRPNHLTAPFNNPAVRRAVLTAINQIDFMTAVIGEAGVPGRTNLRREGIGYFAPESPSASTVGLDRLRKSIDAARAELQAAGAMGARLVLLNATDLASINAATLVGADLFRRMGFNVDLVSADWGTVVTRRASRNPLEQGGWSGFFTFWSGVDHWNPASHASIRGHGDGAWPGWPTIPAIEAQRNAWFDAPNDAAALAATTEMQRIAFEEVPYVPTGMYYQPTAYRRNLTGMLKGQPPLFWNVRRT
ncbi:ABC transporter substrate-binding protein [Roseomonas sp. PWR1]|uniref:ABC transporter substrate-binding protein n=1 Tax=Roseomonas nitratireducens TaxID=2820810 RepID=A0ABS4AQW6_9PROT|nr:ABC transporter substrate-binding protein [Neoroseomonas nitratireducens]MBP0463243.1 ABC transporter substrate-binding protein [Neoroseomonas nitratireducens]